MGRPWDRSTKLGGITILSLIAIGILGFIGWVMNIIALFHMTSIMTGEGAVRIIGIPMAPLGAILGWFF